MDPLKGQSLGLPTGLVSEICESIWTKAGILSGNQREGIIDVSWWEGSHAQIPQISIRFWELGGNDYNKE